MWTALTKVLPPLLLLAAVGSGCAKYNYDIVQPESARVRITRGQWQRVAAPPVAYRFTTAENHLVIQVYNESQGELRIVGERSYVVTPGKQSIPVQTQSIAPGSYVKLILPPVRQVVRRGSSVGFGFGYSTGRVYHGYPYYSYAHPYYPMFYDPWWYEPEYLYVIGDPATYWEWEGETDATLHLVFEEGPGGRVFEQTLVFHRVRV